MSGLITARLTDNVKVVKATTDIETDRNGSAIEGDWINLSQYEAVVCVMFAGALGADIDWQVEQATSDGGSEKDVTGKTVTHTNGTDEDTIKTIEIRAEDLDVDGDYDWIRIQADDPGTGSTYAAAIYLCYGARYGGNTSSLDDPTS